MAPRNVQCPDKGQFNWSVHPDLEQAKQAMQFQYLFSIHGSLVKVMQEEDVEVVFEGSPTIAKRVIFKVRGISGFMAKELEGSNELVVYYIATKVREEYIHCVLSYWTNNRLTEGGLPPLLAEVMQLK
jgi:hypothetical protein